MNDELYLFELPPADLKIADKKFRERNPIWTGCKAKLIERYLYYFVQITHHGNYIDGFAGPQETDKDKEDTWSAKLVIESAPRWLRNFYLFEIESPKIDRINEMIAAQPKADRSKGESNRVFKVFPGDFNINIGRMLNEYPIKETEASFCLLDQRTFECDWASVKQLATHKKGGNKIELFYFFAEGWLNRSICAVKNDKEERMEKWWGNSEWPKLLEIKGVERVQFVANRFTSELGYKYAYPFPIYEKQGGQGRVMYYMIHASDHGEAPMLMNRAYGKAQEIKEPQEQLDLFIKKSGNGPQLLNL